jgi:hypothetical protein
LETPPMKKIKYPIGHCRSIPKVLTYFLLCLFLISCGFQGRKYTSGNYFDFHSTPARKEIIAYPAKAEEHIHADADTSISQSIEITPISRIPLSLNNSEDIIVDHLVTVPFNTQDTVVNPSPLEDKNIDDISSLIEKDLKRVRIDNIGMAISALGLIISLSILNFNNFGTIFYMILLSAAMLFGFFMSSISDNKQLKKDSLAYKNTPREKEIKQKATTNKWLSYAFAILGAIIILVIIIIVIAVILAIIKFLAAH